MNQRGQSLILTLVFLTALAGSAAIVLDVGSWYRADRKLQATADASALAGAQALPEDPARAKVVAVDYGDINDGGVDNANVEVSSAVTPDDTLTVEAERAAPGFFARLFGFNSVDIKAKAVARTGNLARARWAAPVAVEETHPMLQCKCWGSKNQTTLDFYKVGPGAFKLINIDSSRGGTSPKQLGNWMENGLDAWMDKDRWYYSDPGMKPNSSNFTGALDARDETELLFPVYRSVRAQGAGFEYYVVGWAVFHLTSYDIRGSKKAILSGYFVNMIWAGIQSSTAGSPGFGAKAVQLVE